MNRVCKTCGLGGMREITTGAHTLYKCDYCGMISTPEQDEIMELKGKYMDEDNQTQKARVYRFLRNHGCKIRTSDAVAFCVAMSPRIVDGKKILTNLAKEELIIGKIGNFGKEKVWEVVR